jgi:hypothetical protein
LKTFHPRATSDPAIIWLTRKVAITVPDFASAARLVATGSMIATMPSMIALHYSKHYRLNVPVVVRVEVNTDIEILAKTVGEP